VIITYHIDKCYPGDRVVQSSKEASGPETLNIFREIIEINKLP
jgi:hypothetical protein